jgi:hypothetical protein
MTTDRHFKSHSGRDIVRLDGLGWRLERMDHVWMQTEHNAALGTGAAAINGLTVAHMP